MITTEVELLEALAQITLERSDSSGIEAKVFSEFSSKSIGPTISAFANRPGGGTILLGVAEDDTAMIVGVSDPALMTKKVVNLARNGFSTPIQTDPYTFSLDEKTVVVINVAEVDPSQKPCYFSSTGKAYIRQYDGDYQMSREEEQQFLSRRGRPRADAVQVPGTSISDLESTLLSAFLKNVREQKPVLAGLSDPEILRQLNVTTDSGTLTVAGLYALGFYPQRYFPTLALTAAVLADSGNDGETRSINRRDFGGPIPQILSDAVDWVAQNVSSAQQVTDQGHGITVHEVPLSAVREIVANALIHRDLSDAASGRTVELRLSPRGLVLTNPGGLWGLSIDQLGTGSGKSAVNEFLYEICRYVDGRHGRIIEAMGSGIAATRRALDEAGLAPPVFSDNGVRFTVRFPSSALHSPADLHWLHKLRQAGLTSAQSDALLLMRHGTTFSNAEYRNAFGVDSVRARRELQDLVERGLVTVTGTKRSTRYHLASHS